MNPNYLPKITGDICFILMCLSLTECIENKKTIIVFMRTTRRIVCYSHNIKTENTQILKIFNTSDKLAEK